MLLLLLRLFFTFARVALFNFGGGFVMISLIGQEIIGPTGFDITQEEFASIIAISQITPGAVAINTATYVGYQVAGVIGSLVATLAIPIPSFLIVTFVSPILIKYKEHKLNKMIFYGIRAVVVGLIVNAAYIVSKTPFFKENYQLLKKVDLPLNLSLLNFGSVAIFLISLVLLKKYKLNPILVIFIAAILGIVIFQFNFSI